MPLSEHKIMSAVTFIF